MKRGLARLSRFLNWFSGGEMGQSLCARIALRHGSFCLFCRVIAWATREPTHCLDEVLWWLKRKTRF